MSRVVGLDISLNGPGLCVLSGDPRSRVSDGIEAETAIIRAGEDVRGPERLSVVSRSIMAWLAGRGLVAPGRLYVQEGYAFSRQHAHSLGEIGGCVRKLIWESGGNLLVVPPSTLKKYLTGAGVGDKNVVMKHVYKRWGFDVDDDNQCDAFGCALLGLVDLLEPRVQTNLEHDILTKKVQRYAGKDQSDWYSGSSSGKVARRPRRHVA